MQQPRPGAPPANSYRLADIIGALSHALDLTEGQPAGHSQRCCWIGMHVGRALGLGEAALSDLYYTLLLKDCGCSSNAARLWELYGGDERAAKHGFKTVDTESLSQVGRFLLAHAGPGEALRSRIERVLKLVRHGGELAGELIHARCDRGARIVRRLGCGEGVAAGVYALDEHWNGRGRPDGLAGEDIPLVSRIALLAQVADVFNTASGPAAACREVRRRSGTWFDPRVVRAFLDVADGLWAMLAAAPLAASGIADMGLDRAVAALEPASRVEHVDEDRLDRIADAFADIVDAKSPFTSSHSARVMQYSDAIAAELGFDAARRRWLRRAALLHDLGKLGVSNAILDKPGKLDAAEFAAIKTHPVHSAAILSRVAIFGDLAPIAGAHHEKLDGSGYPYGLAAASIPLDARIVTVADIFDALTAARPYRGPMPVGDALAIIDRDRDTAIDGECLAGLRRSLAGGPTLACETAILLPA